MTMTFYEVRDRDAQEFEGVFALDDGTRRGHVSAYWWVPTMGLWVLDPDILRDFRTFVVDQMNTYREVDAATALALSRNAPSLDRPALSRFKVQLDRLTSAQLGLPVDTTQPRPTTDPHTLDTVRSAPLGTWVTIRTFPSDGRLAARTWASEVRLGKKKRLATLGPLEVELHDVAGGIEARVRRAVTDDRLVETARRIAERAHGLQVDKAGNPYVDHPRRVAQRLQERGAAGEAVAAGWLHDVLEDTTVTADDLRAAGIPEATIAAVEAVTKRDGEPVEAYAARIASTPLAVDVKRADLADNTDPARTALLDDATRDRLAAKYVRFRAVLDDALAAVGADAAR